MQSQSEGMKSNEQSKVNLKKVVKIKFQARTRCTMLTRLNKLATDRQAQFFLISP